MTEHQDREPEEAFPYLPPSADLPEKYADIFTLTNPIPLRGDTFVTRKITRGASAIVLGRQDKLYLDNLNAKRDWGHAKEKLGWTHDTSPRELCREMFEADLMVMKNAAIGKGAYGANRARIR